MSSSENSLMISIQISQIWALVIALIGGIGNLITFASITHEIFLNEFHKSKRQYLTNQMMSRKGKSLSGATSDHRSHVAVKTISISTCSTIASTIQAISNVEMKEKTFEIPSYIPFPFSQNFHSVETSIAKTVPRKENNNTEIGFQNKKKTNPSKKKEKLKMSSNCFMKNIGQSDRHDKNMFSKKITLEEEVSNFLNCNSNVHRINDIEKSNETIIYTRKVNARNSIQALNEELFRIPKTLSRKRSTLIKYDRGTIIILALCIADFLYCVIVLPFTYNTYNYYFWGMVPPKIYCTITAFIRYVITYAEWMTVGLLTIERCINLRRHRKAKVLSTYNTIVCILSIWAFSLILQIRPLIGNDFAYDNRTLKCDYVCKDGRESSKDKLYFFTLTFIPCALVLGGCISIMCQIVQNKKDLIKNGISPQIIEQRQKDTRYSLAVISGLLFLFFLCVIPISVNDTIFAIKTLHNKNPKGDVKVAEVQIGLVVYMIYWIQYGVNFIVYGLSNPCFRVTYHNLQKSIKRILFGVS